MANSQRQRRQERAADRLETALAPESGHRFGTWKRHGYEFEGEMPADAYVPSHEAEARKEAEVCLANLRRNNVRPAG